MPQDFTLPSADDAMGTLDQVYARIFFAKMAEFGHVPRTEEDARGMLETGLSLDSLPEPVTKQGSVGAYNVANQTLQIKLAEAGLRTPVQASQEAGNARAAKQAALAFAQYPDVYKAVLSIKAAEANEAAA